MLTKEEWRRRKRRKKWTKICIVVSFVLLILILGVFGVIKLYKVLFTTEGVITSIGDIKITQMLLTKNEFSRPGTSLEKVEGIVIHYVANPESTAEANRNYFERLRLTEETSASSHFIIGLEGEIIQCIPMNEIAYASKQRNYDTISIENCHPGDDGKFNDLTYESLVKLVVELCKQFNLTSESVIRHYDVTEKLCPKYYVENEEAWQEFLLKVEQGLNGTK